MRKLFKCTVIISAVIVILGFGFCPGILASGAHAQEVGVKILSPKDGSEIQARRGEGKPVQRVISGEVIGFDQNQIRKFGLRVYVTITVVSDFPQGAAQVRGDGTWSVGGYFGGMVHTITAVLKDRNGTEVARDSASFTLVQ